MSASTILRLPNEILCEIFRHVELYNLRLTCKAFQIATFEHFATAYFSDRRYYCSAYNLQRFVDITEHPSLAPYTRNLIFKHSGRVLDLGHLLKKAFTSLALLGNRISIGVQYYPAGYGSSSGLNDSNTPNNSMYSNHSNHSDDSAAFENSETLIYQRIGDFWEHDILGSVLEAGVLVEYMIMDLEVREPADDYFANDPHHAIYKREISEKLNNRMLQRICEACLKEQSFNLAITYSGSWLLETYIAYDRQNNSLECCSYFELWLDQISLMMRMLSITEVNIYDCRMEKDAFSNFLTQSRDRLLRLSLHNVRFWCAGLNRHYDENTYTIGCAASIKGIASTCARLEYCRLSKLYTKKDKLCLEEEDTAFEATGIEEVRAGILGLVGSGIFDPPLLVNTASLWQGSLSNSSDIELQGLFLPLGVPPSEQVSSDESRTCSGSLGQPSALSRNEESTSKDEGPEKKDEESSSKNEDEGWLSEDEFVAAGEAFFGMI